MSNISEFPVASDNANVFVPYLNGNLDSIDMNKGDKVWQSELGGRIISAPILDKKDRQNLYIATTPFDVGGLYTPPNIQKVPHTLFLRSINKTTGLTNWLVTVGEVSQVDKLFLYEFQDKIIVISKNGLISAFDKKNGQSIWRISLDNTLTSTPFFSEDKITVAVDKKIVTFSLENVRIYFQLKTSVTPTTVFLFNDKNLFWGDNLGNVYSMNIANGKILWKFRNGAQISNIIFTSKGLFLTSYDNFVYLVSTGKGKLIWKKRFSGRITAEPLVSGNFVTVNSLSNPEVFVLDLSNGKQVNQFSLTEESSSLNFPLLLDNFLVYVTIKGLFVFSHSGSDCTY
ncbi:MAG: PQQ-like beta-propeller repeat protein [Acidobacteria bacterium]|nr:PQQ-like beta-propeller repeat protein [Acidobacteriota bacterium]